MLGSKTKFIQVKTKLNIIIFSFFIAGCHHEKNEIEPIIEFSFIAQQELPANNNDLWGYVQDDKEYMIVVSGNDGLVEGRTTIIDISVPQHPSIASTIPTAGADVKVWKNYLYIAQGSNTYVEYLSSKIYDIANPAEPMLVGTFPAFHNIYIDELGYLFVTGYSDSGFFPNSVGLGVSIYDLNTNPQDPDLIWTAPSDESKVNLAHDIFVLRDKLYTFSSRLSKIEIYDLTNRSAPVLLGRYRFENNTNVHSGWVSPDDQYLYVCLEEIEDQIDVIILNISDPSTPFEVGKIHDTENTIHNLYVIDNYAYTSFYNAGLRIYDLANPTMPELIYEYDTNEAGPGLGAFGVYPFSPNGYIGVSDWKNGLFIFKKH